MFPKLAFAFRSFFGPAPGTASGTLNGSDVFRSTIVSAAILGLSLVIPGLAPASGALAVASFALDALRRLPHQVDAVPVPATTVSPSSRLGFSSPTQPAVSPSPAGV